MSTPAMSSHEAQSFQGYSQANALHITYNLPCDCQPYRDVFTYQRWLAQGFRVKRGEHGISIPTVRGLERQDPDTGTVKQIRLLRRSVVFCRCQVSAV